MDDTLFSSENLLKVLVAMRGSALPKEEKVRVRDLILTYSQAADGPEKEEMRNALSAALTKYAKFIDPALGAPDESNAPPAQSVAPTEIPDAHAAASSFGRTRVMPTFAAPPSETRPRSESIAPSTPPPPESRVVPPAPPPQPAIKPPQPPKEAVAAAPVPPPAGSVDPKARIAEIKRAVNERVGNPVNLIERDQQIGREYMTSLLEAIKYSTGGAPTGGAMARLEAAYKAVTELLDEAPLREAAPAPVPKTPPPPPPRPQPPVQRPNVSAAPAADEQLVMPRPEMDIRSEPAPSAPPPPPQQIKTAPPPPPPTAPRTGAELRSLAETARLPRTDAPQSATARGTVPLAPPAAPPVTPASQPLPGQNVRTTGAALASPDVDAGLRQLLSEWKLFRRSGFLGTGPSGIDHPLYKQLATLPMAAVIAGRFEGATPEVKQNIADYMNGWRYEHGIVHKMEEQFEHYLRRVIAHILKKQKEEAPAK